MAENSVRDAHPSLLAGRVITFIGCGTVGSRVARHIAHWGAEQFVLCDPKVVRERNVGGFSSQIYRASHIGKPKVEALAEILLEINPAAQVETWNRRIERAETLSGIVFAGLDSYEGRVAVRDSCLQSPDVSLLIEGRLGVDHGQVLALDPRNLLHEDRYTDPELWKPFDPPDPAVAECGATQSNMLIAELAAISMTLRLWAWLIREQGSDVQIPNDQTFIIEPVITTDGIIWV